MSEGLRLASLLGYAGFFFLAATVLMGMATAMDAWGTRISAAALEQLHLGFAVAGIAGIAGHITAHVMRVHGGMALWQAFVPFASGGWIVATGVVGWLLMIAVALAVPWRRKLGYRGWLNTHRVAYLAAALTALHVIAASDEVARVAPAGIAVVLTVVAVVVFGWRRARGTNDLRDGAAPVPELEP